MRIRPVFAWYDIWIGAYWDRARRRLYVMVPFVGFSFSPGELSRKKARVMERKTSALRRLQEAELAYDPLYDERGRT